LFGPLGPGGLFGHGSVQGGGGGLFGNNPPPATAQSSSTGLFGSSSTSSNATSNAQQPPGVTQNSGASLFGGHPVSASVTQSVFSTAAQANSQVNTPLQSFLSGSNTHPPTTTLATGSSLFGSPSWGQHQQSSTIPASSSLFGNVGSQVPASSVATPPAQATGQAGASTQNAVPQNMFAAAAVRAQAPSSGPQPAATSNNAPFGTVANINGTISQRPFTSTTPFPGPSSALFESPGLRYGSVTHTPGKLLKPGDFGYGPIKYPESAGVFIKGIPKSNETTNLIPDFDAHQLALLNLCILAEKILWVSLFDAAIDGYIRGELNFYRPIPVEHVDLIYSRTPSDSPLRCFVLESMCSGFTSDNSIYMPLMKKYDEFMEDVVNKLPGLRQEKEIVWDDETIRGFFMYPPGYEAPKGKEVDMYRVFREKEPSSSEDDSA
jgi:hypothetical protein